MDDAFDLVLQRGTVITEDGRARCEVAVHDGRIAVLGDGLGPARAVAAFDRHTDARPGAGAAAMNPRRRRRRTEPERNEP